MLLVNRYPGHIKRLVNQASSQGNRSNTFDWVSFLCVFSIIIYAICNFEPAYQQISLWVLLPLSSVCIFFKIGSIWPNKFLKILLSIFAWSGITSLFAVYQETANEIMLRFIAVYMFCYILSYLAQTFKSSYLVAIAYIVFFVNCIIYAQTHILAVAGTLGENFRLGDEKLNANLFGYFSFFTTFFVYQLGIVSKTKTGRRFWKILFLCLIPLTFMIAILTASRQIVVVQIPYFVILLIYRYWEKGNRFSKICLIGIVTGIIIYAGAGIAETYSNSNLATRSETKIEDDPRSVLVRDAISLGLENLLLGVGPNNFKYFTPEHAFAHNSYLELFADSGVLAVLLYCILIFKFIKLEYINWRSYKNDASFSILIFAILYALYNFFYVFYFSPWLMGIMFFLVSIKRNNRFINT